MTQPAVTPSAARTGGLDREEGTELVVLVDEDGRRIGTAPKHTVHGAATPLHRAFSCYVFDGTGRVLATRRAGSKATFPGVWTNSVCGHPGPDEADESAVRRRSLHELGVDVIDVTPALPRFRYRATFLGVTENEICPVYLARLPDGAALMPRTSEVGSTRWLAWSSFVGSVAAEDTWSPWCREQTALLAASGLVATFAAPAGPR